MKIKKVTLRMRASQLSDRQLENLVSDIRAADSRASEAGFNAQILRFDYEGLPAWRRWLTRAGWSLRALARAAAREAERTRALADVFDDIRHEVSEEERIRDRRRFYAERRLLDQAGGLNRGSDRSPPASAGGVNGANGTATSGGRGRGSTGQTHRPSLPALRLEAEEEIAARLNRDLPAPAAAGPEHAEASPEQLLGFLDDLEDLEELARPRERPRG